MAWLATAKLEVGLQSNNRNVTTAFRLVCVRLKEALDTVKENAEAFPVETPHLWIAFRLVCVE